MKLILAGLMALSAASAQAGVCDYKPSAWVGDTATAAAVGGSAVTAATGASLDALGYYTATNFTTGLPMVGLEGTGFLAGTSGALGTAVGVVIAPEVMVGAAVVAVGGGVYEGGCWLAE